MSTTLTVSAITATTASIAFTNLPGGGWVEIQIADNRDFRGIVTSRSYTATPASIVGLNQNSEYYARGRTITSGLVVGAWGATVGFLTADGADWSTAPQAIMIEPAILVRPAPILAFTNSLETAGYPASNLDRDDPQLVWSYNHAANDAALYIETAGGPIDTFSILDTTASEATTITVKGADAIATLTGGGADFSQGPAQFRASANLPQRHGYHSLVRLPAPQKRRFWRINVSAPSNSRSGVFMARYLVAGLARTAKNISADKVESPLDLGGLDRNRAGGPDRIWGHRMRKVDFEISMMSEMQFETQFSDLWRLVGLTEPMLVVPNSKSNAFLHDRILYGAIQQQRVLQPASPRFSQGFSIESLI